MIALDVFGQPEGLPRPRAVRRGLHAGVYQEHPTWQGLVTLRSHQVRAANPEWTGEGPLEIRCDFRLRRPKSAPKRKVKPHTGRPDLDNLLKSTFDGLVPALIENDAAIVKVSACKRYALPGEVPGATIVIQDEGEPCPTG